MGDGLMEELWVDEGAIADPNFVGCFGSGDDFDLFQYPDPRSNHCKQQFDKAAGDVRKLKSVPSDSDLLELYAYYKQATVGDADPSSKPGMLDLKGKYKWEAWNGKKGMSKEDAMKEYIKKVEGLIASIGLQ
ncbi:Acyl-CoA-binding protein homolog [Eumeta japonica]|uniref:Acyl-CoA-binding protein homolog n=1 Tax=Eumeta variegata TaxID=151549 RepID=A0A4C1Z6Y0_EUMVA|nr:Acyl-CoA-binding protein homolog [Eumeta japonica]